MKKLVVATTNPNKVREIKDILGDFGFEVISRDEAGVPDIEVVEDGDTFYENSYKKAYEIMKACGEITIADDSGLCVDALDGAPGVMSARFSGTGDDKENNRLLLKLLEGTDTEKRTARFVSVITMVWPDGKVISAEGKVEGHIMFAEEGDNGFGYDPLFRPLGYEHTFGVLPSELKNSISHRANALNALKEKLVNNG